MSFHIEHHGSITLIRPMSTAASIHADAVFYGAQRFGGAVVCEPRFVDETIAQLEADGYLVKPG